jgi:hypothetical protein
MRSRITRFALRPIAVIALAVFIGLAAGAWQWVDRGMFGRVVDTRQHWIQRGRPLPAGVIEPARCRDEDWDIAVHQPFASGPIYVLDQQVSRVDPEDWRCFERVPGSEPRTGFFGPTAEDAQLAVVVGVIVYFAAVAFILSYRALRASAGQADTDSQGKGP